MMERRKVRERPQQQTLDFMLPSDQVAARRRMTHLRYHWLTMIEAIENIDCLTRGKRRRAIDFLKRLLKSGKLNWHGLGKVRQKWLASDWTKAENTIGNWMQWARKLGAIDWSVSADESGVKYTTIEFTWLRLAGVVGMNPLPDSPAEQTATTDEQTATTADQTSTIAKQTATVGVHSVFPLDRNSTTAGTATKAADSEKWKDVRTALAQHGVEKIEPAISHAQRRDMQPADVLAACQTYHFHRRKFSSPGALVDFLRLGSWPADGVELPEAARARECERAAAIEAQRQRAETERAEWQRQRATSPPQANLKEQYARTVREIAPQTTIDTARDSVDLENQTA